MIQQNDIFSESGLSTFFVFKSKIIVQKTDSKVDQAYKILSLEPPKEIAA